MSTIERFLSLVDQAADPDACHPWIGATNQHGYGQFYVDGGVQYAHRWLLGYARGTPLGDDEKGLHRCDNPPCCNLTHLYVGDQAQNMRDMYARGRHHRSIALAARTQCEYGHPFTPENTYARPDSPGARRCRTCVRAAQRRSYRRRAVRC